MVTGTLQALVLFVQLGAFPIDLTIYPGLLSAGHGVSPGVEGIQHVSICLPTHMSPLHKLSPGNLYTSFMPPARCSLRATNNERRGHQPGHRLPPIFALGGLKQAQHSGTLLPGYGVVLCLNEPLFSCCPLPSSMPCQLPLHNAL